MALGETETQQQQNEKCWLLDKGFFRGWGRSFSDKYRALGAIVSQLERNPPGKQAPGLFPSTKIRLKVKHR